jgi:hypothetical protein
MKMIVLETWTEQPQRVAILPEEVVMVDDMTWNSSGGFPAIAITLRNGQQRYCRAVMDDFLSELYLLKKQNFAQMDIIVSTELDGTHTHTAGKDLLT